MNKQTRNSGAWISLLAGSGLLAYSLYRWGFAPWHRRWGASEEEVNRSLPGDDLLVKPAFNTTRAIHIQARPSQVWPWVVQIGQNRAGFYSYDLLENLSGLKIHSSDQIVSEYQDLKAGDIIPLEPEGSGYRVQELVPNQYMLLYVDGSTEGVINEIFRQNELASTWLFLLDEQANGSTRLIVRWRAGINRFKSLYAFGLWLTLDAIEFLMEQKMMRGIKQRAEHLASGT